MATLSRTNMLVVATVVTTAILGGAYVLGHTLGSPGGPLGGTRPQSANSADPGSHTAPDTRSTIPSPTAPTSTPGPTAAWPGNEDLAPGQAYGPPQLPAERDGPFGARVTTGSQYVALTFDDGPDPRYTPQALAILRQYQVKATFCLVGGNARAYPQLVRAIAAEGHTLCNHSWAHDIGLGGRSPTAILTDLTRTNEAIRAAVPDARIAYYRQPGGNWTSSVVAAARKLGMTSLHWTVDPRDWTRPGAGNIVATVTDNVSPGAIVLLHDAGGNRQGTMNALYPMLINLSRRFGLVALPTGPPANTDPETGPPGIPRPTGTATPSGPPATAPARPPTPF
ncbi:polysaccharide deacetylase family protein [Plantactinospora soyae]|uniref:Peptidoglycan/xylan/chitin deacetylase (PgdA/CDA1 family) n=1 Tax=Plantactinospora soyae TaxID=1544732 RepID=A0A927M4K7_9ACTN|nr:polysaccharide deacetylase family protein [Plantactinospora soyae]MBE1486686.1 peptidoglycan/xylan/chitin deacetylase (PgdA/CDA1 family) [Plantactinospora soyae]